MFELIARILIAVAITAVSWEFGKPSLDVALLAAYSVVAHLLQRRNLRNAGISGFIAVADAWAIAMVLASAGELERFGFLTLAPLAYAVTTYGSSPASMAPLAVSALLVTSNLFGGKGFTIPLLIQSACVLGIGLMMNQKRIVISHTIPVAPLPENPGQMELPTGYLELRENFRALRDHTVDLERRCRKDHAAVQLFDVLFASPTTALSSMAGKLCELTDAEGLTLYSVSQIGEKMVVQGVAGEVPDSSKTTAFDIPRGKGDSGIRTAMHQALAAIRNPDVDNDGSCVLLRDRGRVVGMMTVYHSQPEHLDQSVRLAEEISGTVAALIRLHNEKEKVEQRLREAELLYMVSGTSVGAETPTALASRVARELWETMKLDHLGVFFIDNRLAIPAVTHGAQTRVVDAMSFAVGQGVTGWLGVGSPELYLFDAYDDQRLSKPEAMKRRVGSFVLIPLQFGSEPYGFLTAATHRVGGIDAAHVETLRVVGAELGQALSRLEIPNRTTEGLATPKEFHQAVREAKDGCMVYLELLRKEELFESYGKPAVSFAVRKFAARMRAKLPTGGVMCRRSEGDYVVYLRGVDESIARSWANDAAATASMIGITTPDGRSRIPLALRAKVADRTQYSYQFSSDRVA